MKAPGTDRRRGFALLEALAAIVIMAGVGAALFGLVNTGLRNLSKAEAHMTTTSLQPQLLAWIRALEIPELPAHRRASLTLEIDETPYRAEADLRRIHGPVMATSSNGQPGIHQLALYDVTITVYDDNRRLDRIRTRRVAHRQVRPATQQQPQL